MASRIAQLTLDVRDARRMADFWTAVLDMTADIGDDGAAMLYPRGGPAEGRQTIWLQPVEETKEHKIRLHLDLRPEDGDVEAEVGRLVGLGAQRADVGQTGEEGFTVLADPEGNEFCILHSDPS
jgi:catechol 2,3-dioxygenase-like lactoylglutathione lyase family enzyme